MMCMEIAQLLANLAQVVAVCVAAYALVMTRRQVHLQNQANQALVEQLHHERSRQRIEVLCREIVSIGSGLGALQSRLKYMCSRRLNPASRAEIATALQEMVREGKVDLDEFRLQTWVEGILNNGEPY